MLEDVVLGPLWTAIQKWGDDEKETLDLYTEGRLDRGGSYLETSQVGIGDEDQFKDPEQDCVKNVDRKQAKQTEKVSKHWQWRARNRGLINPPIDQVGDVGGLKEVVPANVHRSESNGKLSRPVF
ncbi:hypothetical protein Dimus_000529 [Dionaea muscipula]